MALYHGPAIVLATVLLVLCPDGISAILCNNSAVCINSTHLNLCVGYERGYVSAWNNPIPCPINALCNSSHCVEIQPAYPFISHGSRICNNNGFVCVTSNQFQLCKYDRYNSSVPFGYTFNCPPNTVCDNNNRFHCRDSYNNVPPQPVPPPPGWHIPPVAPPVLPPGSNYTQVPSNHLPPPPPPPGGTYSVHRDECQGKTFICLDKKSYLNCQLMTDGVIRPQKEHLNCPSKQVCHKTFDRPCVSAASMLLNSGFSWGFLVTLLFVSLQLL